MASKAAFAFAVVAEARADQQIASELAERVMLDEVDWIDRENLGDFCRWHGLEEPGGYLPWMRIAGAARARGIVKHGKFRQSPGVFDERRARLALRLFKSLDEPPDGVLLVRDTDAEDQRLPSLERVRAAGDWEFEVVLATPDPKRECWVLAGFDPIDDEEEAALNEAKALLGFDPRLHAERLTAKTDKGKRNAKKILKRLMRPESEREESCWRQADLGVLRERGKGSRLTARRPRSGRRRGHGGVLAAGRADLAVMARPHLRDAYLTLHAAEKHGYVDQPWPGQYLPGKPKPPER